MSESEVLHDSTPLKTRLLRNGFWMYFLSFIIAPAGYLIKLMVSRELSVEDIGLVYSIIGFIGLLSAFNDFGLTEALQYYLPQYMIDKEYGKAKTILIITWILQFAGGIVVGGLLYAFAPRMAAHYFHSPLAIEILRYFCIYFLLINLFQVLSSVFTALQNVKLQYLTEAIRLRLVVGFVAFAYFQKSITVTSFAWYWIFGVAVGVVIAGFLFWKEYRGDFSQATFHRDANLVKTQWSYAWKIMIGMQVTMIYGNIGQQFAIGFLGPYHAGIWTNYTMFYTGVSVFVGPIITYLFPLFAELYKKGEQEKILLMKKYLLRGVGVASIGIALGGRFLSEWLAVTLLTDKFLMSGIMFKRTSLCYVIFLLSSICFSLLAGAGLVHERVKIVTIGTVFSLIFSYIFIHIRGLWGLVITSLLTHTYFFVHSYYYMRRHNL